MRRIKTRNDSELKRDENVVKESGKMGHTKDVMVLRKKKKKR